jgi:alpha-methylacyl-CoA racemase
MPMDASAPPLAGLRIIEFAGIGPGPFAGMMLADMGAEIIRIERPGASSPTAQGDYGLDFMARGRKSLALNLKAPGAVELALQLIETADGLIEGFRPGVMERLGLGPDICRARNPRLVYGRMTGWGQDGPIAHTAGHDLNYIALTGALWASGEAGQKPSFPLNLLGDFGGGGMFLAFGMVTGMLKAARSGQGDVVDAAIVDGTSALMTMIYSRRAMGVWQDERQSNALDGGVPWYGVYECADGGWITIGSLEPQFWAVLLDKLSLTEADLGDRKDRSTWPAMRAKFTEIFKAQPRDHWVALLQDTDACFAPVLSPAEAAAHPHNQARGIFTGSQDPQPMPAPRFATSQTPLPDRPPVPGAHSRQVLEEAGFGPDDIDTYFREGTVS